jgi:hypothetical protein
MGFGIIIIWGRRTFFIVKITNGSFSHLAPRSQKQKTACKSDIMMTRLITNTYFKKKKLTIYLPDIVFECSSCII